MSQFLLKKFTWMLAVLLGVTIITFLLMHAIPGNPWSNYSSSPRMLLNLGIDKSLQDQLNQRFGLDLPLWRQYTRYMVGDFDDDGSFFCGAVCGNLGPSIQQRGRSVQHILFAPPEGKTFRNSRFGFSIRLVFYSSWIAVGFGVLLGILSVTKAKGTRNSISVGLAALISIPNFVLGLLTIIVLASGLKLMKVLPDWNIPSSWIVPAFVLAVMPMASIARVTQASLQNVMNEDYIRTARAKGLTQTRVMLVHVLRNAIVPIIAFMGPTLMEMFTGLLIVENLYSFPGFGREYWNAVLNLDYPLIMGLTLIYATGIALVNVLVEILGEMLDPRIRASKQAGVQR
jgi:oligopeptide transport system permease protein